MRAPYQQGELETANAALTIAQRDYRSAERALAQARANLTRAELYAADRFRALTEKCAVPAVAETDVRESSESPPPAVFTDPTPHLTQSIKPTDCIGEREMADIIDLKPSQGRDLIAEMTGPAKSGNSVIIDGRLMPNVVMRDLGEIIEFVLDERMAWPFPRDIAWQAASFAIAAMAIGAGFAHPSAMHSTQRAFAPECVGIGDLPK